MFHGDFKVAYEIRLPLCIHPSQKCNWVSSNIKVNINFAQQTRYGSIYKISFNRYAYFSEI
jgi:hypothetical protein